MPTCQNGWPAIEDAALLGRYTIPGTEYRIALRPGDSSVILLDWLGFLHAEVEPLLVPGVWGWAFRLVRGSDDDLSNHAGGDAVDASAPRHPLGTGLETWRPHPQSVERIRRRLAAYEAVAPRTFRWGGDYSGRLDTMHGELLGTVSSRRRLADAIRGGRLPNGERSYLVGSVVTKPSPAPSPTPAPPVASVTPADRLPTLSYGMRASTPVRRWQAWLASRYPLYRHEHGTLPATGNYLDVTVAWTREFQARSGITGADANGRTVGPRTKAAAWAAGFRG